MYVCLDVWIGSVQPLSYISGLRAQQGSIKTASWRFTKILIRPIPQVTEPVKPVYCIIVYKVEDRAFRKVVL
jgi:hypothetical protein